MESAVASISWKFAYCVASSAGKVASMFALPHVTATWIFEASMPTDEAKKATSLVLVAVSAWTVAQSPSTVMEILALSAALLFSATVIW